MSTTANRCNYEPLRPTEPPHSGSYESLYQRYLDAFQTRIDRLARSNAPECVKVTHLKLEPLVREHFEAEIACGTKAGQEILAIIQPR